MTSSQISSVENTPAAVAKIWSDTASERVKELLRLDRLPVTSDVLHADLVVIGAGVSGLSAARTAAAEGASVILLERGTSAASGASGQNAGIVCMGANMLLTELADSSFNWLWTETTKLALELYDAAKQSDAVVNARMVGSVTLAVTDDDASGLKEEVETRHKLGLPAEMVSIDEVKRLTDSRLNLTAVKGALLLPQEGRCHPWSLCAHLAVQARKAGARLYGDATVESVTEQIAADGKSTWYIRTARGATIMAKAVMRCVGPTVEPNERIYAMAFSIDLPDTFPVFQDAAHFTYYDHRYSDKHIVCTGGLYAKAGDRAADPQHLEIMANKVRGWLPELQTAEPKYIWAVDLKVAPDMVPHLRHFGNKAPAASVEGLGALGVLPGILLGKKGALELVSRISG
jgi:glycine/D-amino acid oxidase-like deaminating enzyme